MPFNPDKILIMDPLELTGAVLCQMADSAAGRHCSRHIYTLASLRRNIAQHQGKRLLVIMELFTTTERLSEGFRLLSELRTYGEDGKLRVMVLTGLSEPLLLKAVTGSAPFILLLRQEPVPVLKQMLRRAFDSAVPGEPVLSPGVVSALSGTARKRLPARELEWLLARTDGYTMGEAARLMNISYKTVWTYRRNLARRLDIRSVAVFRRRLAEMQQSAGWYCG